MNFSLHKLLAVFAAISIAMALAVKYLPLPCGVTFVCLVSIGCGVFLFPRLRKELFVLAPVLAFMAFCSSLAVHQFPIFYYAEYNAVERKLSALPDVKIIDSWKHEDVSLQHCCFILQTKSGSRLKVDFWDSQEDWTALFERIDGVVFSVSDGSEHYASVAGLSSKGLSIENIPDLLRNAEEFLMVATQFPQQALQDEKTDQWVYVSSE